MDAGQSDQVHTERLNQQEGDHAAQTAQDEGEDGQESERGGALHRLAEQGTARDDDDAA